MRWTQKDDLRQQVQQLWDKGSILASMVDDEPFFPKRLILKRPTNRELSERFDEVRQWIASLQALSGFRIDMKDVRHRVLGDNAVPTAAWVDSLNAVVMILGKKKERQKFAELIAVTRARHFALIPWVKKQPIKALSLAEVWEKLLDIVDWVKENPRPAVYLRQVDIPGIDTKFLECHRGVLAALLDQSLPASAINEHVSGVGQFALRYGFVDKPARVRIRILDPDIQLLPGSNQDITVTQACFGLLDTDPRIKDRIHTVFITENETNFLTFPSVSNSMVLFGAGYGFDFLSEVNWLPALKIYYWGDIDTHGFAILDQLRARLPKAQSLLMDESTLLAHRSFWEEEHKPECRDLSRLTLEEKKLYEDLRSNRFSKNLRLEQERIQFRCLCEALGLAKE